MQQKQISSKKLDLDKNPFYDFQYFLLQVEDTISERRKLAVVLGQRSFVLLPRQLSKMKENFTRKVFCIFGYKSSVNNHLKGTHCRATVAEGTKLYFVLLSPKLRPAHERYLFEYNWSKTGSSRNHNKLQDASENTPNFFTLRFSSKKI